MKRIEDISSTLCRTLYILCLTVVNNPAIVLAAAFMLVLEAVQIWAKTTGFLHKAPDTIQQPKVVANFGKLLLIRISIALVPFLMISCVLFVLLGKYGVAGFDSIDIFRE